MVHVRQNIRGTETDWQRLVVEKPSERTMRSPSRSARNQAQRVPCPWDGTAVCPNSLRGLHGLHATLVIGEGDIPGLVLFVYDYVHPVALSDWPDRAERASPSVQHNKPASRQGNRLIDPCAPC